MNIPASSEYIRDHRIKLWCFFLLEFHTSRACDQSCWEVFTTKYNISALKGTDLRENKRNRIQQQIMFLQCRVTYTWKSVSTHCQNGANPIYHCKIFAKAHPRAKVSQTNTHRLKAARKITEWAGCLLLLVYWQLFRSKAEPSPAFFRCRIFLW